MSKSAKSANLPRFNPPSAPPSSTVDSPYVDPLFNSRTQRQLARLKHYKLISISFIPAAIFFIVVGIITFSLAAQNNFYWLNWIGALITAIGIVCLFLALIGLVAICIAKGNSSSRNRETHQRRPVTSGRTSDPSGTCDSNFHGFELSQNQTYDHSYGNNVHGAISSHNYREDDSSSNQNQCLSNDFGSDPPPSYDASTGGCDASPSTTTD